VVTTIIIIIIIIINNLCYTWKELESAVLHYMQEGKINKGRPRVWWRDNI